MADLNDDDIQRLAPIFLEAFNARWGTSYRIDDYRKPVDGSADLLFTNSESGDLKVQWTTPPSDEPEKRLVAQSARLLKSTRIALSAAGLRGVTLVLDWQKVPVRRSERQGVVNELIRLTGLVREKYGTAHAGIRIPRWDMSRVSAVLADYFTEIHILAHSNPESEPLVGGGDEMGALVPDSSFRAEGALEHKATDLGRSARDLVLVIHFDMDAYDDDDVEDVQRALEQQTDEFKQVWILRDTVIAPPTAHCVKVRQSV